MTYRTLTEAQWETFAAAESVVYRDQPGIHGVTDVRYIEDSEMYAMMWDDAMASAEMCVPFAGTPEGENQAFARTAVAVAFAAATLAFGPEFTEHAVKQNLFAKAYEAAYESFVG